ncbi:MAG: metal ABC transporter substrate-binding protein [Brevinema sp.]
MRIKLLFIVSLMLGACSLPKESSTIVTGIAPIAQLAKYIGGESVTYIIPKGNDPHRFTLKPSDAVLLEKAQYIVSIHPAIDGAILRGAPNEITLFTGDEFADHDHGHSHGAENPHYWLSFIHSKDIAYRIADVWANINPEKRDFYFSNAQVFVDNIDDIASRLKEASKGKQIAALQQHSAWDYLLEELDIKILGSVEAFEGDQISPIRLAEAIALVNAQPNVILIDDAFSAPSPVLKTIQKETGAQLYIFNPMATQKGANDILSILSSYGEILVQASS